MDWIPVVVVDVDDDDDDDDADPAGSPDPWDPPPGRTWFSSLKRKIEHVSTKQLMTQSNVL